jgi:hypothetical protein
MFIPQEHFCHERNKRERIDSKKYVQGFCFGGLEKVFVFRSLERILEGFHPSIAGKFSPWEDFSGGSGSTGWWDGQGRIPRVTDPNESVTEVAIGSLYFGNVYPTRTLLP